MNTQQIDPMSVVTGAAEYPAGVLEELKAKADVTALDALSLAVEAGSSKAVNVVLMGVVAKHMEFSKEAWEKVVEETVPPKFRELNLKAFELGYNL